MFQEKQQSDLNEEIKDNAGIQKANNITDNGKY